MPIASWSTPPTVDGSGKSPPALPSWAMAMSACGRKKKGRGGKVVTVISGLPLAGNDLKALAKQLKKRCGGGGAVKDGNIELQGDHVDILVEHLQKAGFAAKRAGG